MKICAGIDAGSRTIKMVLMNAETLELLASGSIQQSIEQEKLINQLFNDLILNNGINKSDIARIVATGYGRNLVRFADTTITEITCHAFGVNHLVPHAKTIVEIGGQDSKVIHLNDDGSVRDFSMNDRCAAGTGRFLEVIADRMNIEISHLEESSQNYQNPAIISSMCVVFAETEIIGLLASGTPPESIIAGVQLSIAQRIASMLGRYPVDPILFTGGVALVPGMGKTLETVLTQSVEIAPNPQFTGALGAAILASRKV